MDRSSMSRPVILAYSRRIAFDLQAWLLAHDAPATVLAASTPEEARPLTGDVDILFGASFPIELFASAPHLHWIQSMNAGVEELVAAESIPPTVTVTRVIDQFGKPIAEYVFAECLAHVRDLDRTRTGQRERHWDHFIAGTLEGKTLGVAGLGSIGREIVRKGRAFDMTVFGSSRTGVAAGIVDRHFGPEDWLEFVADVDVLVLTLPRTTQTEGVISRSVLAAMRPDSMVINVGRGALIDEGALIDFVRSGRIGGAILDVFQQEPLPTDNPFWSTPNVTVTPHISGPSTVDGVCRFFLANLHRYLTGDPLLGVVDRARGY
ncbi:MAG TPA: D-2-hydroxyacid dehydrogenase [Chloroflexota bacterium]